VVETTRGRKLRRDDALRIWKATRAPANNNNFGEVDGDEELASDAELKLKYQAELAKLQAEQLKLKNSIALGEYVPRTEIVGELGRYFTELKRSLMGLSRKVATEVGPFVDATTARRIERDLSEIVTDALERMSAGEVYVPSRKRQIRGV
jgi:hypothetical protein